MEERKINDNTKIICPVFGIFLRKGNLRMCWCNMFSLKVKRLKGFNNAAHLRCWPGLIMPDCTYFMYIYYENKLAIFLFPIRELNLLCEEFPSLSILTVRSTQLRKFDTLTAKISSYRQQYIYLGRSKYFRA